MKKLIIMLLCVINTITVLAQITIEECQQLALSNYPQIKQYGLIDKITQFSISNIAKGYLPQIGVSAQATWQNAVPAFPEEIKTQYSKIGLDMSGLNKDQYKVAVEINQSIWDGGAISAQKQNANADDAVSRATLDVELYSLKERINNLYFGIMLLEENCLQNDELQRILQSNYTKIQACIDNGIAQQSDLESVKVELLSARQQRTRINTSCESYRKMLGVFIGKEIMSDTLIKPNPEFSSNAVNARPELTLFETQRGLLSAQRATINSSLMPRIGAFAQGYYGNPGFNMFEDMLNNHWTFNFLVGIKVQWSIGSLYTKKNNIQKIEYSQQRVNTQEKTFLFNNNLEVVQAEYEITRIQKEMKDDDEIIYLRKSIRVSSEAKLTNGIIDVNDLIRDISAENQAKLTRSIHNTELLKTMYDLKQILNK